MEKSSFVDPKNAFVSWLDLPWIKDFDYTSGWDEIIYLLKEILARLIEYLPMIVLVLLLLACIKIIFDWDAKEWWKRIKYILIGVWLMIICIYIVNVISTIMTWMPLIHINFHRFI